MSKLDDKLRNLKNDIPHVPEELDQKVMNAMLETSPKVKFPWKKIGILSAAAVPLVTFSIILYVVNRPTIDPPLQNETIDSNTGMTAPSSNTEAAVPEEEPGNDGFDILKSASINGVNGGEDNESYSHFDLTYASTHEELIIEVNKYHADYQIVLEPLISEIRAKETYFADNYVAIVPFMFSSSETDITLSQVKVDSEKKETAFIFHLYSPVDRDADLRVTFYVVTLDRGVYDLNTNHNLKIDVINTRDAASGSYYYNK